VREADNLTTFMCRKSWKSENLNVLEASGPHRACYGTLLPLTVYTSITNDQNVGNKISHMTHNKIENTQNFLKYTVYYTGQQTSNNFHTPVQHFTRIFQLMHTTLQNVELLKHFKIRKLLHRVSVYKETIIREP